MLESSNHEGKKSLLFTQKCQTGKKWVHGAHMQCSKRLVVGTLFLCASYGVIGIVHVHITYLYMDFPNFLYSFGHGSTGCDE